MSKIVFINLNKCLNECIENIQNDSEFLEQFDDDDDIFNKNSIQAFNKNQNTLIKYVFSFVQCLNAYYVKETSIKAFILHNETKLKISIKYNDDNYKYKLVFTNDMFQVNDFKSIEFDFRNNYVIFNKSFKIHTSCLMNLHSFDIQTSFRF